VVQPPDRNGVNRRKARNRRIILGFFAFIGVVVLLESPLTRVRGFSISGNTSIPSSQLLADTSLHVGMSLWQVNRQAVADAMMAKEPLIQAVHVRTDDIQGIVHVQVEEKHIVAVYARGGKFYDLLNDGVVYGTTTNNVGFTWPIVTAEGNPAAVVGQVVRRDVQTLCEQLALPSLKTGHVSEIHLDAFGDVTVYMDNGFAAQSRVQGLQVALVNAQSAIQYFLGKGYPPGRIDMTGPPPYRYTPFAKPPAKKGG